MLKGLIKRCLHFMSCDTMLKKFGLCIAVIFVTCSPAIAQESASFLSLAFLESLGLLVSYSALVGIILLIAGKIYLTSLRKDAVMRMKLERRIKKERYIQSLLDNGLSGETDTDFLTGLPNKRFVTNYISLYEEEISNMSSRNSNGFFTTMFCLMLDLDNFKEINDQWGHQVGDSILRQVGDMLKEQCADKATPVRWGGDEFLIFGHLTEYADIEALATNLCCQVRTRKWNVSENESISITASLGFSLFPGVAAGSTIAKWEQIQSLASRALSFAKSTGKQKWSTLRPLNKSASTENASSVDTQTQQSSSEGLISAKYMKDGETVPYFEDDHKGR